MKLIRRIFFHCACEKIIFKLSFFFLDSVKLLSLNEEEPHEKELGHVTIQLFESDVKKKKIGISEWKKARSSF